MTEPQNRDRATWWVCCYECEPTAWGKENNAPGLVLGFGWPHQEELQSTELAAGWMGTHGDEAGHRQLVMLSAHPLLPGETMPRPRHGKVVLGDVPPGTPLVVAHRGMRFTPLDAEGKPTGPAVHMGQMGPAHFGCATDASLQQEVLPGNGNGNER